MLPSCFVGGRKEVLCSATSDLGLKSTAPENPKNVGAVRGLKSSPGCTGSWPQSWKWRSGLPAHPPHLTTKQEFAQELGFRFQASLFLNPPELLVGKGLWAGFAAPGKSEGVSREGRGRWTWPCPGPLWAPPASPTSRGFGAAGSRAALQTSSSSAVCIFLALVGTNSRQNVG